MSEITEKKKSKGLPKKITTETVWPEHVHLVTMGYAFEAGSFKTDVNTLTLIGIEAIKKMKKDEQRDNRYD